MTRRTSAPDVASAPFAALAAQASPDGTARFVTRFDGRFADDFFRRTATGLTLSSIGIGTYLGDCTTAEDERYVDTVQHALASGVNVIDTAINYRCQRSERAIGEALRRSEAANAGGAKRDEVLVCTKGGFLPLDGAPVTKRAAYDEYLKRVFFASGVMGPDDVVAGGHSMAPPFLRYCIARSRKNLGVRTIDVYYLHNPEQQFASVSAASFRERLRAAFMVFEDAVTRGDIASYGCATWNGLRVPPSTKGHLSLRELLAIAREVAGDGHHFRYVQMPINLAMPEALRSPTQARPDGSLGPALDVAVELGLTVVASASLMQAQLTAGLPDAIREHFPRETTDAQRALSFVRSLPGLTTALVGMRSRDHVNENLGGAHQEGAGLRAQGRGKD
jgi:aryl-alcohol dehydrogenase-like predicted oxidoreductase